VCLLLRVTDLEYTRFRSLLSPKQVDDAPEVFTSKNGASSSSTQADTATPPPGSAATPPSTALLPQCAAVAAAGASFLVAFEARKGSCGQWSGAYGDSLYNRYHAAYCGAHALWPFSFHQTGNAVPSEAEASTATTLAAAAAAAAAAPAGAAVASPQSTGTTGAAMPIPQQHSALLPPPPRGVRCPAVVWQLAGYRQPPTETSVPPPPRKASPVSSPRGGAADC